MLSNAKLMAFAATTDATRAKAFYQDILGLQLISDESFALVFDANGTQLRIQKVQKVAPAPFTVLGWEVEDIKKSISALKAKGVGFEHFGSPHIAQDDLGIWTAEDQTQVAWFKDPDGNIASLTQLARDD